MRSLSAGIASCLLFGLIITSVSVAQPVVSVEALRACAQLADPGARLACYDNLGERVLAGDASDEASAPEKAVAASDGRPAKEAPVAAPSAAPTATGSPAPASVGRSTDSSFGKKTAEQVSFNGVVTSCKKGHYGNWFFIFEGGQVWQEVNMRNRRFKNCNFKATITKDMFGYKMQIEGQDKSIRVRRNR